MPRIKTKKQKIQSQKKKNQNIEKLKNAEIEFQKSIKKLDYRDQEKGLKTKTTNSERQAEFVKKQSEENLKKYSFWLSADEIKIIEDEQKSHLKKYKIRLNRSKILAKLLRKI